ncbi:MAG: DUF4012 domain-containing protein [Actinomycetota bacterium]
MAVVATAALLLVDAVWAGWMTRAALLDARDELACGAGGLGSGDVTIAVECMRRAEERARDAEAFGVHPAAVVGSFLPWIGDDVRAVVPIARAARWAASGGATLARAATEVGWGSDDFSLLDADGTVDLRAIEAATPELEAATADLERASSELRGLSPGSFVAPLARAAGEAEAELERQTGLVLKARTLAHLLPGMLGGGGPRRYLLAFQNLSAPRGTGGFLGFVGTLEADAGRLTLASLDPVADVPQVAPVAVPAEVARRYGPFGVRTTLWASNYPPDVPTSSRIAMAIWREAGQPPVDGVVWTDTIWMAEMLRATGPVTSIAWPDPVTADNLVEVFHRGLFEGKDSAAIDAAQGQLGVDLFSAIFAGQPTPSGVASAVSTGASTGHLALFVRDETEESSIEALGAAGRFELGDNPLAVVWQDASASKAGYFAERTVTSHVTLHRDGSSGVETTVTMQNDAPTGPPSALLGDGRDVPVGWWGVDVEVYMPTDAVAPKVTVTGHSLSGIDEAFGHPLADAFLFADPGERSSATVTYEDPAASVEADGIWTYRIQLRPQPAIRAIGHTVEIELPEGADIVAAPRGSIVDDGIIRWEWAPTEPVELVIAFSIPR